MNISKRLRVIGDLVSSNSFILDVGCDHALLDIYVTLKNKNIRAIASDIKEGPLKIAKENVLKYKTKVEVVLGDGLESYKKGVDTVVLSGLGSVTIVDILSKDKNILFKIDKLIISSNNDYYYLRNSLCKLGFMISDEKIVYEKGKYYPIVVFNHGKGKYNNYELKYGPILLKEKEDSFIKYLKFNKNKLIKINNSLGIKYFFRKIKIKKEIKFIDKVLLSKM